MFLRYGEIVLNLLVVKKNFCCIFLIIITSTISFSFSSSKTLAQESPLDDPEYFMGILILESEQEAILNSIKKVKDLQLGNMVILHPMDQAWNLTLIEDAIKEADNLGLYTIFETYNASDHIVRISPEQFANWKAKYPYLLGILVQEVTGKQIDNKLWANNSTGNIKTRIQAEQEVIENLTSSMKLPEFKNNEARIFLQENVISYVSANTSYCDVFISKVFNAPNLELMISQARGMINTYNISDWGLWIDTWKEWTKPPAFSPNDVERALYEAWFYGAKYFFFEQGNFFGTLNRDWPTKHIILGTDGKLTEYGKVIKKFYAFLKNEKYLEYNQPNYDSSIAIMIGQSGWGSRGSDWGLWDQSDRQGDFDYQLLNIFFPGIGDNWNIGHAKVAKPITGLPFGMVDLISVYAPSSVMENYEVILGLGWNLMTENICSNIENYVKNGGVFISPLTFTHSNQSIDDLEDPYSYVKTFSSLFGVHIPLPDESGLDVTADVYLQKIIFTEDTFWFPWSEKTYNYFEPGKPTSWFWKFKYFIDPREDAQAIAWINNDWGKSNALIIENKKGTGFTYIINTRNLNSLPDGVYNEVITDFLYFLCTYHVKPMIFLPYPKTEFWLSQGQNNRIIYLSHDNSTNQDDIFPRKYSYHLRPFEVDVDFNKKYLLFEYLNKEFYKFIDSQVDFLDIALKTNQSKVLAFLEDNSKPQVIYSDTILNSNPTFSNNSLKVTLNASFESENLTKIYCSDYEEPTFILGLPYDIIKIYEPTNKILNIFSDSNISIGWANSTDFSVLSSSASINEFFWNSSRGLLNITTTETSGQKGFIEIKMGESRPYFFKVDDTEVNSFDYNQSTGVLSANYTFTSNEAELSFGFNPINIDRTYVSDDHADVDSTQKVGFHASWMNNNSDLSGATVWVNGIEYVTNKTGWINLEVSNNIVEKTYWNITGVSYRNLTEYAQSVIYPKIIWDRINITNSINKIKKVQTGSFQKVWINAEYEFGSEIFDNSSGTLFLNEEPMVWSSQNSRWELNVTTDSIGLKIYNITSVSEKFFDLTSINDQNQQIDIIWDKIAVNQIEFNTMSLELLNIRIYPSYIYTMDPVVNATVLINGVISDEIESGVYVCELSVLSPIYNLLVEVEHPKFDSFVENVINLHVSNTIFYFSIGLALLLTATFLFRKKEEYEK